VIRNALEPLAGPLPEPEPAAVRIGPFALDLRTGELRRDGVPVPLAPQPTRLLVALARRRGELVTREEIRAAVWDEETFVDFTRGLNFCVLQVRAALGDNAKNPRYIETIPRRGYRLAAERPEEADLEAAPQAVRPSHRRHVAAAAVVAGAVVLLFAAWQRSGAPAASIPETSAATTAGTTASDEAHDAYLRGRSLVSQRKTAAIRAGLAELRKATALDPGYALAHLAVAEATHTLAMREEIGPREAEQEIRSAATAAFAAAPSLAQTHAVAAMLHFWYEWDWNAAEESYRRAMRLNPGEAGALHDHGWLLITRGHADEGIALIRRAQELDPDNPRANTHVAWAYIYTGRYALAVEEAERALQLSPGFEEAYHCLEEAHLTAGDYDAAFAVRRDHLTPPGKPLPSGDAHAYYLAEWQRLAGEAAGAATAAKHPYDVAAALALAGRIDPALDWLERARDAHDLNIPLAAVDPKLRWLHGHPRFAKLVASLKL